MSRAPVRLIGGARQFMTRTPHVALLEICLFMSSAPIHYIIGVPSVYAPHYDSLDWRSLVSLCPYSDLLDL
jgi:hypothetical protein